MIVADIKKNIAETIRVQIAEFKGVRVHVENAGGRLVPTKMGISR